MTIKPLSLYQITEDLEALEAEIIDAGGQVTPEIEERYDELLEMQAEKVADYVAVIRRLEASAAAVQEERKRLQQNEQALLNSAKALKTRLHDQMVRRGETEHQTTLGKVKIVRAGGRAPVILAEDVVVEALPERFKRVQISADMLALHDALEAGDDEAAQLAHFGERSTYLRIY